MFLYTNIINWFHNNIEFSAVYADLQFIRKSSKTLNKPHRQKLFNQAMAKISDGAFPQNAPRFLKFLDLKSERYETTEQEVNEIFNKFPRFRDVPDIVTKHVKKDRKKNLLEG